MGRECTAAHAAELCVPVHECCICGAHCLGKVLFPQTALTLVCHQHERLSPT